MTLFRNFYYTNRMNILQFQPEKCTHSSLKKVPKSIKFPSKCRIRKIARAHFPHGNQFSVELFINALRLLCAFISPHGASLKYDEWNQRPCFFQAKEPFVNCGASFASRKILMDYRRWWKRRRREFAMQKWHTHVISSFWYIFQAASWAVKFYYMS